MSEIKQKGKKLKKEGHWNKSKNYTSKMDERWVYLNEKEALEKKKEKQKMRRKIKNLRKNKDKEESCMKKYCQKMKCLQRDINED